MASIEDSLPGSTPSTVQKGAKVLTPTARARPTTPAEQEAGTVQVWPHLVVIEFLAALIFTINLTLLSTLVNGPLDDLANPDSTPNPSKAPWYFLNLQELLLHMNPALAGVIVPTIALVLIAIIPYVDRGSKGLGVWFYSPRGPKIAIFSAVYTTVVCFSLIFLDANFPLKANFSDWLKTAQINKTTQGGLLSFLTTWLGGPTEKGQNEMLGVLVEAIVGWIIPTIFFAVFSVLLVVLLKVVFKGIDLTEMIIGLFTGFVTVYAVLTFVGTSMRGHGMALSPPWDCQCSPSKE
jgi:menaquinol-cytochrome c reductase cytochrome b/c subunit